VPAYAIVLGTEILITWWAWERLKKTGLPGAPVEDLFPSAWGLWLGIRGVLIGHVVVLLYHTIYKGIGGLGYGRDSIQKVEPTFSLFEELREHLSRPEAFTMLVPYLSITWMFKLMPKEYYDLAPSVSWFKVFLQLAVVDLITYAVHRAQHRNPLGLYQTHKDHHVFVNPHIFNAYSGSWKDTTLLIIIPLYATVVVLDMAGVHITHADYMWFGAVYANYFMLIHSEFPQPWDRLFLLLGIGTSEDHNVHHSAVHYNFGHFFMWWDRLFGTYKHPHACRRNRRFVRVAKS